MKLLDFIPEMELKETVLSEYERRLVLYMHRPKIFVCFIRYKIC